MSVAEEILALSAITRIPVASFRHVKFAGATTQEAQVAGPLANNPVSVFTFSNIPASVVLLVTKIEVYSVIEDAANNFIRDSRQDGYVNDSGSGYLYFQNTLTGVPITPPRSVDHMLGDCFLVVPGGQPVALKFDDDAAHNLIVNVIARVSGYYVPASFNERLAHFATLLLQSA